MLVYGVKAGRLVVVEHIWDMTLRDRGERRYARIGQFTIVVHGTGEVRGLLPVRVFPAEMASELEARGIAYHVV